MFARLCDDCVMITIVLELLADKFSNLWAQMLVRSVSMIELGRRILWTLDENTIESCKHSLFC